MPLKADGIPLSPMWQLLMSRTSRFMNLENKPRMNNVLVLPPEEINISPTKTNASYAEKEYKILIKRKQPAFTN